jgi:putative spermidine/putrescine transport system permease protein
VLLAAIVLSGATYGIGANLFLVQVLGLKGGWILAVPIEVVYTTPFGVIIILASLPQDLAKHEQAAAVLGASRLTVFREIVIPQVWSTVLGAAVFSFTLAYNESQRSLLVLGQEVTVANRIFAMTSRTRPTPEIFALGTVSTVFSIILLVSAIYFAFYRE